MMRLLLSLVIGAAVATAATHTVDTVVEVQNNSHSSAATAEYIAPAHIRCGDIYRSVMYCKVP